MCAIRPSFFRNQKYLGIRLRLNCPGGSKSNSDDYTKSAYFHAQALWDLKKGVETTREAWSTLKKVGLSTGYPLAS